MEPSFPPRGLEYSKVIGLSMLECWEFLLGDIETDSLGEEGANDFNLDIILSLFRTPELLTPLLDEECTLLKLGRTT